MQKFEVVLGASPQNFVTDVFKEDSENSSNT